MPEPTYQEVVQDMDQAIEVLYTSMQKCPWTHRPFYVNWLAQTYFYVARTTRLLALASARTPLDEDQLHLRLLDDAAKEEKGHEKLVVHDLKALGCQVADFKELPQTAFFYQTLYYLIENVGPSSIFGYALLLEGVTARRLPEIYRLVVNTYGVQASTFLKVHCEVDVHHFGLSMTAMEKCQPAQLAGIKMGIEQCGVIYDNMLQALRAPYPSYSSLGKDATAPTSSLELR